MGLLFFAVVSASPVIAASENSSLDWMAGHWCLEMGEDVVEEIWLPPSSNEDTEAIRSARESSNQAIVRHDAEAIASFLDSEYVITTGAGVIEAGREGADESWAQHFVEFPDVVYVRTPSEVTISNSNPLAVEHGTWVGTRTTPDGIQEKGGQYTASWRKVDGGWRIRSELFVTLYEKTQ